MSRDISKKDLGVYPSRQHDRFPESDQFREKGRKRFKVRFEEDDDDFDDYHFIKVKNKYHDGDSFKKPNGSHQKQRRKED
jgi:hypothetical protein